MLFARARVRRRGEGRYQVRLRPNELALVEDLVGQLREQLVASTDDPSVRRLFPPATLEAIEASIRAAERLHSGEIRVAIETCLDARQLWAGTSARDRARDVFARLRVWDTALNSGVLIYLLLADHDIEIVADRGFEGRVSDEEWQEVCRCIESEFRAGQYEAGVLAGVRRVSALIARHFPPGPDDRNELPDRPVFVDWRSPDVRR